MEIIQGDTGYSVSVVSGLNLAGATDLSLDFVSPSGVLLGPKTLGADTIDDEGTGAVTFALATEDTPELGWYWGQLHNVTGAKRESSSLFTFEVTGAIGTP